MDTKYTQKDIVFQLTPQQISGDTADKRGPKPAYYISKNSFPIAAEGWINGVYYPRQEQAIILNSVTLSCKEDYFILPGRVWKETEETGFGVYQYENTDVIQVPLENADYDISILFTNPTDQSYRAFVKANDIIKAETVEVGNKDVEITFSSCVIQDELCLKILPESMDTTREASELKSVYVKQITIRKQAIRKKGAKTSIFLASDSTVQTYPESLSPQTGWGQVLIQYFQKDREEIKTVIKGSQAGASAVYEIEDIIIENRAIGGRSSRSFIDEGRLDQILQDVKPGDYVFVQFGHNDATKARPNRYVPNTKFAEYIQCFINGVRQRKGTCVLITPVARRNCEEEKGVFQISFPYYRRILLDIIRKQRLPLLDLGKESTNYLKRIGPEESKELYLWVKPGEYPESKYADGVTDNTHLRFKGAEIFAGLVAKLIKEYETDDQLEVLKKILSKREEE